MPGRVVKQFPPAFDHWMVLTKMEQIKVFRPSSDKMKFILELLKASDDR